MLLFFLFLFDFYLFFSMTWYNKHTHTQVTTDKGFELMIRYLSSKHDMLDWNHSATIVKKKNTYTHIFLIININGETMHKIFANIIITTLKLVGLKKWSSPFCYPFLWHDEFFLTFPLPPTRQYLEWIIV